jgi:hypothetical protein
MSFDTGRLSPVSAASAVCRIVEWIRRTSAAMVSPSSMSRMSPGTSSAAAMLCREPPRITFARAAAMRRSAATACSARDSWMWPMSAFSTTTARIAIAS